MGAGDNHGYSLAGECGPMLRQSGQRDSGRRLGQNALQIQQRADCREELRLVHQPYIVYEGSSSFTIPVMGTRTARPSARVEMFARSFQAPPVMA